MPLAQPVCPGCKGVNAERHCEKSSQCSWMICRDCVQKTVKAATQLVWDTKGIGRFFQRTINA